MTEKHNPCMALAMRRARQLVMHASIALCLGSRAVVSSSILNLWTAELIGILDAYHDNDTSVCTETQLKEMAHAIYEAYGDFFLGEWDGTFEDVIENYPFTELDAMKGIGVIKYMRDNADEDSVSLLPFKHIVEYVKSYHCINFNFMPHNEAAEEFILMLLYRESIRSGINASAFRTKDWIDNHLSLKLMYSHHGLQVNEKELDTVAKLIVSDIKKYGVLDKVAGSGFYFHGNTLVVEHIA